MAERVPNLARHADWLNFWEKHPVPWVSGPDRVPSTPAMPMLQRLCSLICLALLAAIAYAATPEERLVADHAAWTTARQGYEERVATGTLDAAERRDYEAFLDDLAARVLAGCRELHALKRPVPTGVACPETPPVFAGQEPVANPNTTPPEKDRAALDAELGASLGQFDELLLREQDRVRAARPRVDSQGAQASSSAGGGREGAQGSSTGGQDGSGEQAGSGSQGTQGGDTGTTTAARGSSAGQGLPGGMPGGLGGSQGGDSGGDPGQGGLGAPGGSGAGTATPSDLPDPSGDDVVARQLREAAEAERDPELRARLWEEYRRYRGGIN